jgi:hypothetical protein
MAGSNRFWPARAVMRRRQRLMRRMMRSAGFKPQDAARVDGGFAILEARTSRSVRIDAVLDLTSRLEGPHPSQLHYISGAKA